MKSSELIEKANKTFVRIIEDITSEQGTYNSGNLASYIAILFKLSFATIERDVNLEAARQSFKAPMDYMMDAMIDGSYDRENNKVK